MQKEIRILHLEDLEADAVFVERELKKGNFGFKYLWVKNESEYEKALTEFSPDIVLSDHSLPSYTSREAFHELKQRNIKIPFILITATLTEEFVLTMIREGIDDYILKDRLQRLPSAVVNAIERRQTENDKERYMNEVIRQEKKFRALIENLSEAIVLVNKKGEITYQSPSAENITGYSSRETLGRPATDFLHPDEIENAQEFFSKVRLHKAVPLYKSYRILHKNGGVRWVEGTITNLLMDANVKAYIINYRDITERKKIELEKEKMTNDLIQHNRNLEQFAYIISHNLRAPVANILGLSNLLQNMPDMSKEDFNKCVEGLYTAVKRLDDIVIDLNYILSVRRDMHEKRERLFLSDLVADVKTSIADLIKKENVKITTDFSAVDEVFTIKSYLQSIFYNLISNSIKYKKPTTAPTIHIQTKKLGEKFTITFTDTGLGIDLKAHEANIFGLYKRFHLHIEGKGMGLFMVKTQVEILGGKINIKSEVNKGTEFIIELPL